MTKRLTSQEALRRKFRAPLGRGALGAAIPLALVLLLPGCQTGPSNASSPAAAGSGTNPAPGAKAELFTLPADQLSHLAIATVEKTRLPRTLRLTGAVTYNSFETTPVITQVGGPVSRILVSPGQIVRQNQPMLYVSSPDYAQLRANYLKARDAFQLADKFYQRAVDLFDHHAIAQADLQQAESTRSESQADLQAAEQGLKVLGVHDLARLAQDPGTPEVPVLAPIGGEVVERLASPGQVIQAGQTQVFTISNMSSVWVLASVYERDLGLVRLGDAVSIQSDAYPETFHGRISYISSALDPATRTLQVRIVTSNPGRKLKKDMYVTALVEAGVIEGALAVPDSAVLRNAENQPFVYVAQDSNQFAQRLVEVGESHGGKTQITGGLEAGERVVADGSLFLQFANSFQR
jgi:membrane fusion protein, heavy metal efflux system